MEHGTDSCDLTGEVHFIRRMIDRHHDEAIRTGARIVNCCGYDSIPSDIGCFVLHEHYRDRGGGLTAATMYVGKSRGGVSGGTIASMMNMMEDGEDDPSIRRLLKDPYSLNPEEHADGPDTADIAGVQRDAHLGGWNGAHL